MVTDLTFKIYKHLINLKLDNNSNSNVFNIQNNKWVSLVFINIFNFVMYDTLYQ